MNSCKSFLGFSILNLIVTVIAETYRYQAQREGNIPRLTAKSVRTNDGHGNGRERRAETGEDGGRRLRLSVEVTGEEASLCGLDPQQKFYLGLSGPMSQLSHQDHDSTAQILPTHFLSHHHLPFRERNKYE
ncbi:hypothetical protein PIB30_061587 [Stylosanthes scabra]|uniref:Uncharacterized protein n=1 Tax=Stylosanthes scabra TaxID=79078 RepID=A0ABU6RM17_9FABA|nr:hypothetical protein [Stylosanthes scabra]